MKAAKNSKEFNRNVMSTTKKKVFKKKGNSITPAKTNAPISKRRPKIDNWVYFKTSVFRDGRN